MTHCYSCYFDAAKPIGVYANSAQAAEMIAARVLRCNPEDISVRYVKSIEWKNGTKLKKHTGRNAH